jgi:hypothetical protein
MSVMRTALYFYPMVTPLQPRDIAERRISLAAQREIRFGGGNTGCFFNQNLK